MKKIYIILSVLAVLACPAAALTALAASFDSASYVSPATSVNYSGLDTSFDGSSFLYNQNGLICRITYPANGTAGELNSLCSGFDNTVIGTYYLYRSHLINCDTDNYTSSQCAVASEPNNTISFDITSPTSAPSSTPPVGPPVGGAFLSTPTGTANLFTAEVSSQFADPGMLEIVALAIGIPLFFVIVDLLIGLFAFQRETDKEFKRITDKYK